MKKLLQKVRKVEQSLAGGVPDAELFALALRSSSSLELDGRRAAVRRKVALRLPVPPPQGGGAAPGAPAARNKRRPGGDRAGGGGGKRQRAAEPPAGAPVWVITPTKVAKQGGQRGGQRSTVSQTTR